MRRINSVVEVKNGPVIIKSLRPEIAKALHSLIEGS